MHARRRIVLAATLFTACLTLPVVAQAQGAYPNRPIKFVVPYSAGGLPDTVARIFAQRLQDRLGQSVVVDNKPGANGVVAASVLAAAPADGYTFLVTDGSMFSINPAIYRNLSYEYKRDFIPVSLAARAPLYLAVHPKTGVNTLQDFVAMAKARPGALNYGSSGVGSSHHLTMEAMKASLGIDVAHVPFKGSSQSVPAPALAMERTPGLSCFRPGWTSSLNRYPGPPLPVPVGSPHWTMKLGITRWKVMPS